jgi:sugar-specific transcriptional regulator TrmB
MDAEEQALKNYGLSDNESRVYLSTLMLGASKANDIAVKANMLRTTTYEVLNSLLQMGLVSKTLKEGINHFMAVSPKELLNLLDEKKKNILDIIPNLMSLQNNVSSSIKVESFEGLNGMKTITNDILSEKNYTYKIFGGASAWLEFSKSFGEIFYRKKKENKIKSRAINPMNEKSAIIDKKLIANSDIRYLNNMDFTADCFIYLDKVAFLDFEKNESRGVIIKDKEFNRLMNFMFDQAWEKAKP